MIIKNARFYQNGKLANKDIQIEGGSISAIGSFKGKGIDASGLFVFPGLIDPHVHLRDPGLTQKEDFHSGTRAALRGGFTTVLDMPNTIPPTTTKKALLEKRKIAGKKAVCDYGLHFGATKDNFSEVEAAKPPSLKLYMGESTGSLQVGSYAAMEKHFSTFPKDKPIILHAEDADTIKSMEAAGLGRGPMAERIAVLKANEAAQKAKRVIYFAHTTTAEAASLAKSRRDSLVEVSPHHLFLSTDKDLRYLRRRSNVYPPLRTEAQRTALWKMLPRVDTVGSDHAPHTLEDKAAGAAGFPGLETSLSLFLDAYNKSILPLPWIVERMAQNPARIFNLKKKGQIAKGFDADFTLVDLREEWTVRGRDLESRCGWTPFEGFRLKGRVKKVILRGNLVVDDSKIVDEVKGEEVL
ncbi:dihydroorotase family protein [Candidatus Micrarchaeota archaeon]|nr:dihydroorotase family protein [Candidatus Micrarchaeota archaeon]